jgi:hypothetical protein
MKCKETNCQNEALEGKSVCIICSELTEKLDTTFAALGIPSSGWIPAPGDSSVSSDHQSAACESSTFLEQLRKIRNTLNSIATEQSADMERMTKELVAAVKHLDVILESFQHSDQQASWGLQQAVLNGDLERERRRIEPIKPANPEGPHRIIWKDGIGF